MQDLSYKKTFEGLFLTVKYVYPSLQNYLPNLHSYEGYETYSIVQIKGKYHNANINTVCLDITITFRGTDPHKAALVFVFKIDVDGVAMLKASYINVRVVQYCFEYIRQLIIEQPICDNKGVLFPIPDFGYGEGHFENDRYEL